MSIRRTFANRKISQKRNDISCRWLHHLSQKSFFAFEHERKIGIAASKKCRIQRTRKCLSSPVVNTESLNDILPRNFSVDREAHMVLEPQVASIPQSEWDELFEIACDTINYSILDLFD